MPVSTQFDVSTSSHEARLEARGEIDLAVAPSFRDALCALAETGLPRVLVDLSAVTFMDSSGVKALISARRHTDRTGAVLVLVKPSRPVRRVLEVTGFWSEFRICDDA